MCITWIISITAIIVILQADLPLVDGDYCWADGKSVSTYDRSPNQHDLRILSPCFNDFDLYDFMVRIVMTFMVTIAGLMTILSSNTTGFEMIHLRIFFPCFCDHDEYYGWGGSRCSWKWTIMFVKMAMIVYVQHGGGNQHGCWSHWLRRGEIMSSCHTYIFTYMY